MIELSHSISLYIPSHDKDGQVIDSSWYITTLKRQFAQRFGGATVTSAKGLFRTNDTYLHDTITKVMSYCTEKQLADYVNHSLPQVIPVLKEELNQDSIAVEFTTGNSMQIW